MILDIELEKIESCNLINDLYEYFLTYLPQGVEMKEFISSRADVRNKILYSEDGGHYYLKNFEEYLKNIQDELFYLCWGIGILLDQTYINYALINQVIELYKKILKESNIFGNSPVIP